MGRGLVEGTTLAYAQRIRENHEEPVRNVVSPPRIETVTSFTRG